MQEKELTNAEINLVAKVEDYIRKRFVSEQHFVGAGALSTDGTVFLSQNLAGSPRGIDVCGEPGVLSQLIGSGKTLQTIVAVRYEGQETNKTYVVSPCGGCRELILRYCPDANVIVLQEDGNQTKVSVQELLPYRYKKVQRL